MQNGTTFKIPTLDVQTGFMTKALTSVDVIINVETVFQSTTETAKLLNAIWHMVDAADAAQTNQLVINTEIIYKDAQGYDYKLLDDLNKGHRIANVLCAKFGIARDMINQEPRKEQFDPNIISALMLGEGAGKTASTKQMITLTLFAHMMNNLAVIRANNALRKSFFGFLIEPTFNNVENKFVFGRFTKAILSIGAFFRSQSAKKSLCAIALYEQANSLFNPQMRSGNTGRDIIGRDFQPSMVNYLNITNILNDDHDDAEALDAVSDCLKAGIQTASPRLAATAQASRDRGLAVAQSDADQTEAQRQEARKAQRATHAAKTDELRRKYNITAKKPKGNGRPR